MQLMLKQEYGRVVRSVLTIIG